MTSQGQRFRRRALRRGYKVDEVDAFLDRVEATLAGDPIGSAVSAQEVHDVVFRVRFGGYDEWQVDLHLDRVERQLGDLEERSGGFVRTGPGLGRDDAPPLEPRRPNMPPPPMPSRPLTPMPAGAQMSGPPMGGHMMPPMMAPPPMSAPPLAPRPMSAPPMRPMSAPPLRPMSAPPMGPPMSAPPMSGAPMTGHGYPRFDDTDYNGNGFGRGPDRGDSYGGRRGRSDMTHEMRFDLNGSMPTSGGPAHPGELQRIDSMRRTFTARRFGSGYDAVQVNRLFDAIIASLSGRSGMPLSESELDPNQFSLVPGGYFEAEVNQALREVRDLVRR